MSAAEKCFGSGDTSLPTCCWSPVTEAAPPRVLQEGREQISDGKVLGEIKEVFHSAGSQNHRKGGCK